MKWGVELVVCIVVEGVEDVGGGGEHEGVAAEDGPVAVVEAPAVEVLADVPAAVVHVDAHDRQRKHRSDVEQPRVVLPDLQVPQHRHAHHLHHSALPHCPRIREMDHVQQQSDDVRDGRREEERLQHVVHHCHRPTGQVLLGEVVEGRQQVECLHLSQYQWQAGSPRIPIQPALQGSPYKTVMEFSPIVFRQ